MRTKKSYIHLYRQRGRNETDEQTGRQAFGERGEAHNVRHALQTFFISTQFAFLYCDRIEHLLYTRSLDLSFLASIIHNSRPSKKIHYAQIYKVESDSPISFEYQRKKLLNSFPYETHLLLDHQHAKAIYCMGENEKLKMGRKGELQ